MNTFLEIRHLDFYYHRHHVLKDVSFSLAEGEVIAIIGPSGSGKSTLLRSISLIAYPLAGEILFNGAVVFSSRRTVLKKLEASYKSSVGMVFQELYLWPHLTALQNVILPLKHGKRLNDKEAINKGFNMLSRLGMLNLANQYPAKLSVGQQQRCAIARTLVMDPSIILLDEITSALDPELVVSIQLLIKDIASDPARSLLVVTHQMEFALAISQRILWLTDGAVAAFGKTKEIIKQIDRGKMSFELTS